MDETPNENTSERHVARVLKAQEQLKDLLKELLKRTLINGMSTQDLKQYAEIAIKAFLRDHKDIKENFNEIYQTWERSFYANFNTMYAVTKRTADDVFEKQRDRKSAAVYKDLKRTYNERKNKYKLDPSKESYTFYSGIDIPLEEDMTSENAPNLKFIRTNAEYGYTQMQIDNYVEKVERVMDKVAKMEFVATNSRGARISLRSKAEMEVRWQDMLEDLKELKHDKYVIVSQHKDSSLRCACWQGLIYLKDTDGTDITLKDWHEWNNTENHITPKQKGTLPDGQPYYSLREAMECGLFSYNCRHRLIKYEAGVKVPKQYAYNPNEESKSSLIDQHMRQMEQNIRRAKERQTLALSAKERAKWQEKSKALQKKYDEFCKKNNRVRNDWRTVIGRQERRGMKAVEQAFDEAYIDPKASAKEAGIVKNKINKENQKEKAIAKIEFVEAKTIQEAEEFVKSKFEVKNCTFKGLSIENVNSINKQVSKIFNMFPRIKGNLKSFGTAQELNKMIKVRAKELLIEDYKKSYPKNEKDWETWASKYANKFASKVSANTYAYHFDYNDSDYWVINQMRNEFKGIYLNKDKFKDNTANNDYQHDVSVNYHPIGTTSSSIIIHELGHALDKMIGLSSNKELNEYYNKVKNQIGDGLSRYAQTNIKEFLAEGFAEYISSLNPRKIAKNIGKFYEKLYNKYKEKDDKNDN